MVKYLKENNFPESFVRMRLTYANGEISRVIGSEPVEVASRKNTQNIYVLQNFSKCYIILMRPTDLCVYVSNAKIIWCVLGFYLEDGKKWP
jgi:hypothetical protein